MTRPGSGPSADTTIGSPEYPELITEVVLSPRARSFAFIEIPDLQTHQDGFLMANLAIWDADTGNEVQRIELALTDGARPGSSTATEPAQCLASTT